MKMSEWSGTNIMDNSEGSDNRLGSCEVHVSQVHVKREFLPINSRVPEKYLD